MTAPTPGQVHAVQVLADVDKEMDQAIADKSFPRKFPQWIEQLKSLKPHLEGTELKLLEETIDVVERVAATHSLIIEQNLPN